jgi:hypothetical protein
MAARYILQASGAMRLMLDPDAWAFDFAVFVTDEEGIPVEGLKKNNFLIWDLTDFGKLNIPVFIDVNSDLPTSHMLGVYVFQTQGILGHGAPSPQQFLFSIRASESNRRNPRRGFTTVAITYLGAPQ